MNERIRELAQHAGFMVDQSGCIMVCFTSNGDSEVKKFAELIVKKCAEINYNSPFHDGEFHAREVLEYFGVEE